METLIIIVAFWFILIGVYGAMPILRNVQRPKLPAAPKFVHDPLIEQIQREVEARPPAVRVAPRRQPLSDYQPDAGDPYAEVSMLRAQIEHLRSELVALSGSPDAEPRRSRGRRYKVGPYTDLPGPLRRQVREVRSVRRPVRRLELRAAHGA